MPRVNTSTRETLVTLYHPLLIIFVSIKSGPISHTRRPKGQRKLRACIDA